MPADRVEAVLWDFGGVLTTSPFERFNRYEAVHGLPKDFIRGVNATNPDDNAWARFEASRISLDEFDLAFLAETRAAGHPIRGRAVIELLAGELRPRMVAALAACKAHFVVACLTNNMKGEGGPRMAVTERQRAEAEKVMALFDEVFESSRLGVRKPEPRFYERVLDSLALAPEEAVYLDDLGINLKPARALGMTTIKVVSEAQALAELSRAVGLEL